MALTLSAPVKATEIPAPRGGSRVDHGPNMFLDNGWLQQSFDDGDWYDVNGGQPINGGLVEVEIVKGNRKGQMTERLDGDVAEVTRQLREAAEQLGIGVSIKYYNATTKAGKEIPGKTIVKYLGQKRKAARKPKPTETV